MKTHKENIARFLELGGSEKIVGKYRIETLPNRAKVLQLLRTLEERSTKFAGLSENKIAATEIRNGEPKPHINFDVPKTESQKPTAESTPTHTLLGIIAQYPPELHPAYKSAFNHWIDACALKIELNRADPQEVLEIQNRIHKTMQAFDDAKKALDYYNENRAILPTKATKQLPETPLELDRRLRSLRTLITRRNQTVEKLIAELPAPDDPKYPARREALNKKLEQLEEYQLEAKEIALKTGEK